MLVHSICKRLAGNAANVASESISAPLLRERFHVDEPALLRERFHVDESALDWEKLLQSVLVRLSSPISYLVLCFRYSAAWWQHECTNKAPENQNEFFQQVRHLMKYIWRRLVQEAYWSGWVVPFIFNFVLFTYISAPAWKRSEVQLAEVLIPYWLNIVGVVSKSVKFNLLPPNVELLRLATQRRLLLQFAPVLGCTEQYMNKLRTAPLVSAKVTVRGRESADEEHNEYPDSADAGYLMREVEASARASGVVRYIHFWCRKLQTTLQGFKLCLGVVATYYFLNPGLDVAFVVLALLCLAGGCVARLAFVVVASLRRIRELERTEYEHHKSHFDFETLDPTLDRVRSVSVVYVNMLALLLRMCGHQRSSSSTSVSESSSWSSFDILCEMVDLLKIWRATPYDEVLHRRLTRLDALTVVLPMPQPSAEVELGQVARRKSGRSLLRSYMIASEERGAVDAKCFCEQLLVGFSYPQTGLNACAKDLVRIWRACVVVALALLWIFIPFLVRGHKSRTFATQLPENWLGAVVEIVWVSWGTRSFVRVLCYSPMQLGSVCRQLRSGHESLNSMLLGPELATSLLLPPVTAHAAEGMLVWSEARGILTSSMYRKQLHVQVVIGFSFLTSLGCVASVIHFAIQPHWVPGVLSAVTVLIVIAAVMFLVPALVDGLMLNMTLKKQINIVTAQAMEVNTFEAYMAHAREHHAATDLACARELTRSVQLSLLHDTRNVFTLLGMEMTVSGLGSIASAVYTAGAFLLQKLNLQERMLHVKFE